MGRIETVKVVNGKGFKIINKSDFDPKIDKKYPLKRAAAKTKKEN